MKKRAKYRLRKLHVGEVSLVDRAANQREYLILKSETGDKPNDSEAQLVNDEPKHNDSTQGPDKADQQAQVSAAPVSEPTPVAEPDAGSNPGADAAAAIFKADGSVNLDAVPESAREAFEAIAKANERLAEQAREAMRLAKAERDHRVRLEFIAKAESELPNLSVDREMVGDVLFKLHEADPELAASVEQILRAANEQIEKSHLFRESGTSTPGATGSAWEAIQKAARAKQEADPSLSNEAATALVMKEQPDLYSRYLAERN